MRIRKDPDFYIAFGVLLSDRQLVSMRLLLRSRSSCAYFKATGEVS